MSLRSPKEIARGLTLRCDWGPQYIADAWINEVKWLGITISPSYLIHRPHARALDGHLGGRDRASCHSGRQEEQRMITVELISAPGCGNCRAAKALVAKLIEQAKAEIADLDFEEVDITERPEVAVKYRVMSVPAIAINGRLAFTGVPREADLRRALLSR